MNLELERVELREIELPLKAPFETSFGRVTRRRILLVRVFASGSRENEPLNVFYFEVHLPPEFARSEAGFQHRG